MIQSWHLLALIHFLEIPKSQCPSVDDCVPFCSIVYGFFRQSHIGHSIESIDCCDHVLALLHTPNSLYFYTLLFYDRQSLCILNWCHPCDYVRISLLLLLLLLLLQCRKWHRKMMFHMLKFIEKIEISFNKYIHPFLFWVCNQKQNHWFNFMLFQYFLFLFLIISIFV